MRRFILALLLVVAVATARADCAGERWPVKVATDADAALIHAGAIPTTIPFLRSLPPTRPLPQDRRVQPVETTMYSVTATLTEYRLEADGDAVLLLSDGQGRTIVARIPAVACTASGRFAIEIRAARLTFDARFTPKVEFQRAMVPVEIRGVAFFDFLRGQRGVAPNGLGLHPVTSISFRPLVPPVPPKYSRRRAVQPRRSTCTIPSLALTASKTSVCSAESVTLDWRSSDPSARVSIDGIGVGLPASGSRSLSSTVSSAYSGRASNSCGTGYEAVAVVNIRSGLFATLSGPSSLQRGATASLSCSMSAMASWSLTSVLHNSISPSSGTRSGAFTSTYTASSKGTDTLTLNATGDCGPVTRTLSIFISEPANQGLLCCDGTRSPTCFSCSNKQGCCSGHKGVCDCK